MSVDKADPGGNDDEWSTAKNLMMSTSTTGWPTERRLARSRWWTRQQANNLRNARHIINMVAQCNKQVKEQLTATSMHLHLHRATSLERVSASDDECEIVCSKFRVVVRCVCICEASWGKDSWALNARLCWWMVNSSDERSSEQKLT